MTNCTTHHKACDCREAIPDEEPEPCDPRNPYGLTASERGWVL